jgi:hypothetical protein
MKQQLSYSGRESLDRVITEQPAPNSGSRNVTRWRAALDTLIAAPVRLHRYRHLHAEVVEDALRAFDCGPKRGDRS